MLRFVAGLKTAEIARLFLVAEPTMAARLTRAKAKMALAGIPLRQPDAADLPARLDVVLKVVYLLFTEGYRATAGTELTRPRLAAEAIRLGYLLGELLPGEDETVALLALMIFQHARRDARVDHQGRLVRMADQDRGRWRLDEIGRGRELLARLANSEDALATSEDALEAQAPGAEAEAAQAAEGRGATREGAAREGAAREGAAREGAAREGAAREGDHAARSDYHLQALIAAEHSVAGATDWQRIAQLYAELERRTGSPVVRLNRAVAIAEAGSPEAALSLLEGLDATLPANHFVPTARAELLLKIGRRAEAASAFDEALRLVRTDIERAHLERRRAEL
jgi:RNA polymerase sigma-70 factor (ECF subfamily)